MEAAKIGPDLRLSITKRSAGKKSTKDSLHQHSDVTEKHRHLAQMRPSFAILGFHDVR